MVGGTEKSCIFCDIVEGKAPCYKICEDDLSLAILDINPFSKGHCLVIPKRHVPWWHDLTEAEISSLFRLAKGVAEKMMKALNPDFVCMYVRGRRIPHTHLFLVPTYSGDVLDKFFNALEVFQESPPKLTALRERSAMEDVAEMLRMALPAMPEN
jgi:histidine triad (HIT) family protein